ncbi:hypothetical protein BGZ51_009806, partial [Haplosporangium sp. Z 767]
MPRISDRQRLLANLRLAIAIAVSEDDEDMQELFANAYLYVESIRYIVDLAPTRRVSWYFEHEFETATPTRFKALFRTTRTGFDEVQRLIENHPVFSNNSSCQQTPIHIQLGVALSRLGTNGTGSSVVQHEIHSGFSTGAVTDFTQRIITALLDQSDEWIRWPDTDRRREISKVMAEEGFPGCVGFIDGTTLPLSQKPGLDGEVYFDRKK